MCRELRTGFQISVESRMTAPPIKLADFPLSPPQPWPWSILLGEAHNSSSHLAGKWVMTVTHSTDRPVIPAAAHTSSRVCDLAFLRCAPPGTVVVESQGAKEVRAEEK